MIDYSSFLGDTAKSIKPSGIRKFFDIAAEMADVISLSVGEPDFRTPWHIRQAGIDSLEKGRTRYTPNRGYIELREEIASFLDRKYNLKYSPQTDVIVTVGGSEAIDLFIRAIVQQGDEVLIPEPSFVCYVPIVQMAGGKPVIIETKVENNFKLTAKELESHITEKTKALILPYPNNPTGAIMNYEDLKPIADLVEKHNLLVLSDEIYSELSYGEKPHVSFASIKNMQERTVVVNGFSKSHAMTGWRMGYAAGPTELIAVMTKLHQYAIMSAPTTSQFASIVALKDGDENIDSMREEYNMRRRYIVKALNKLGLTCFEPEGAFYVFPSIKSTGLSSDEFCEKLIYSKKVAVIPGNAFGQCGEGFIRISYCYSLNHIKEALKRIEEMLEELKIIN
ncbi:MAG: aminotransferase class I/II-fold pyridoxal phosphate-dependent enzyme [Clostridia bacterium]